MAFLIGGANSAADTGFNVDNSCRFDRASNPHMTKTQSDGDRDKWTFSCWFKLGSTFGAIRYILTSKIDGSNYVTIEMDSADKLRFGVLIAGSYDSFKKTNRVFRDVASWMHLVCVYDSENGTAGHRQRVYINGVEETSWASDTTTTQNQDSAMNYSSADVRVGNLDGESSWWDGYLAEVCLVDGSALAPTAFGEFDEDSPTIWKPIDVSGLTFGNNGFYLDMEDSSNLGNDKNGGTDLTEANLAAADQATDTCTNNFCVMNPLDNFYKAATFSEGNLRTVGGASSKNSWITSTFALSSGKWYCEMVVPDVTTDHTNVSWGISDKVTASATQALGTLDAYQWAYRMSNGQKRNNNSSTAYGNTYAVDEVVGLALNLDDNELTYYINNTVQNSGTAISITAPASTDSGHYFIACGDETDQNGTLAFNFGGCSGFAISSAESDENGYGNFEFAPPSGFYAICTKNLAEYG